MQPPSNIKADLRPISLTSTLSKLLESYVGNWMVTRVLSKLDQKQYGALRGRSTTHALVHMTHMWYQALDQSLSARVLFVDFSKAFDRVDHTTVAISSLQSRRETLSVNFFHKIFDPSCCLHYLIRKTKDPVVN